MSAGAATLKHVDAAAGPAKAQARTTPLRCAAPVATPFVSPFSLHHPAPPRLVRASAALWSVNMDALDLAAAIPNQPQTEVVFALQQRGIGMLECLATLQAAPSLSHADSAAMEVAACLAQPFMIDEDQAQIVRESASEAREANQQAVTRAVAKEVALASHDEQRRRRNQQGQRQLQRRHSLDDTDLVALGLLESGQKRPLDDFTSPSTKLLIATLHSLSLDQKNEIQLPKARQLQVPTETIDLQEPDHDLLLSIVQGNFTVATVDL